MNFRRSLPEIRCQPRLSPGLVSRFAHRDTTLWFASPQNGKHPLAVDPAFL
jgi:hypothetical protein